MSDIDLLRTALRHVRHLVCLLFSAAAIAYSAQAPIRPPTFTRDVAPIFFRRCVGCHHPNDIAPMSLVDYKSARPWAKAIRQAVLTRKMPPWSADPAYGHFSNDSHLSDAEIQTIVRWVETGAGEGNVADLPAAPQFTDGWRLGKPDKVVDIGRDYVVEPEKDNYEHFVVTANLREGRWIRAVEIRPGNRRVVHHVHVNLVEDDNAPGSTSVESMADLTRFLERDGTLTKVRDSAPVADDGCRSDAPQLPYLRGSQEGALASFLPGREPDSFPEGTAKWIPAGSKFEFVIHYARTTLRSQTDRTSVGLYFAPEPPKTVLRRMDLRNFFFLIPPGDPSHEVMRCYVFESDSNLLSITPHMHYRGHDIRYELMDPAGNSKTLLLVPHYDFGWQMVYRFEDPVPVAKGSRLMVTAHYDNSANNPANPDPTKLVRWGDRSEDEMMTSWIEYVQQPAGSSRSSR